TTLSVRYTFDNSADNPRNPRQPPTRVTWGQWSQDEMADLWIQVLTRDDRDLQTLNAAFRAKAIAEDIVGYESMIRRDPRRVQLHDDVAQLYLDQGRATEAAAHLEASVRLKPESAAAHFNFGTALTAAGRLDEAIDHYREALRINPDYALAHNNLGNVLLGRGNSGDALRHFREALRLDPSNAEANYNVGSMLRARGDLAGALVRFRQALQLKPDWLPAVASLAWLLATAPDAARRYARPTWMIRPRTSGWLIRWFKSIRGSNDLPAIFQFFRTLTSSDFTGGSRVAPRCSTVSVCVPCVSATVLLPTETVVVSGKPW